MSKKEMLEARLYPEIGFDKKTVEAFRYEITNELDDFKPACRRSRFHAICDAALRDLALASLSAQPSPTEQALRVVLEKIVRLDDAQMPMNGAVIEQARLALCHALMKFLEEERT